MALAWNTNGTAPPTRLTVEELVTEAPIATVPPPETTSVLRAAPR